MTVKVGVIMGSDSDWSVMEGAVEALKSLGVSVEATVVSAHRTPERLMELFKVSTRAWARGHCCWRWRGGSSSGYGCSIYRIASRWCAYPDNALEW